MARFTHGGTSRFKVRNFQHIFVFVSVRSGYEFVVSLDRYMLHYYAVLTQMQSLKVQAPQKSLNVVCNRILHSPLSDLPQL